MTTTPGVHNPRIYVLSKVIRAAELAGLDLAKALQRTIPKVQLFSTLILVGLNHLDEVERLLRRQGNDPTDTKTEPKPE